MHFFKIKNIALFSFLLILFNSCIKEQVAEVQKSTFIKTFGKAQMTETVKVFQLKDGNYVMLGYSTSDDSSGYNIVLAQADVYGNESWFKTLGGKTNEKAYDMQVMPDESLLILGSVDNIVDGNTITKVLLIKATREGEVIWQKTLEHSKSLIPASFIIENNKIFIACSEIDGSNSDAAILLTDTLGNNSKVKTLSTEDVEKLAAISTFENRQLLFGTTTSTSTSNLFFSLTDEKTSFSIIGDSLGSKVSNTGKALKKIDNNNFLCLATSTNNSNTDLCLIKFTILGETEEIKPIWTKYLGTSNDDVAGDLAISGSNYFLCGTTTSSDANLLFIKTDTSGNQISLKTIGGQGNQRANGLIPTSDGGNLIYGTNEYNGVKVALLIKMEK